MQVRAGTGKNLARLREIVSRLRSPSGCLWDRAQDERDIARYLLEEAYEVVDAIEHGDDAHLREELGDLLLQVVFHAQIAAEEERFSLSEILDDILTKLERRHPHIFGDVEVTGPAEVVENWETIKTGEKETDASALDGVPRSLPSLALADKLQSRAARTGFDWEDATGVADKIVEEARELAEARDSLGHQRIEDELGDLLFSAVNLARHLDTDPEVALRRVCDKFEKRFRAMERLARERGEDFRGLSLGEKEKLWGEAKVELEGGGQSGHDSQDQS